MRREHKISVSGHSIIVKELTIAEIRDWMMTMIAQEKQNKSDDVVSFVLDQGLFEDVGLTDILRMTSLQKEELEQFSPSQLQIVIQKCKELNPDFFCMRGRLIGATLKTA